MKIRHAAVLTLVGWYLLAPPLTPQGIPGLNAPLSNWVIVGTFDTGADCREVIRIAPDYWREYPAARIPRTGLVPEYGMAESLQHARCIATNDPHLKQK